MANHKSVLKRIRANVAKYERNRYHLKSTRTAIKKLRNATDKVQATEMYPNVTSMIDNLAKRNIIHKNNAANKKSKLANFIAKMA